MSPGDRAEHMERLRRDVQRIERRTGAELRRARRLPLDAALDRQLGGGLAADALHEIAPAAPADASAALGFALALAAGFMAARRDAAGLWAAEDFAWGQGGYPYAPGLAAHGLDLSRLLFVRAPNAAALFQTIEDALKSGALAVVVGEVGRIAKYDLAVSRRLTLAARTRETPALLVRPRDGAVSTAAETRFEIAAAASVREASAGAGCPLPGPPAFAARLVKARLGPGAESEPDPSRTIRLIWRSEERKFEPTISVPLAAAPADRSRAARG